MFLALCPKTLKSIANVKQCESEPRLYCSFAKLLYSLTNAVVAEWLRRLTRNQFPYGSAGSNPARSATFLPFLLFAFNFSPVRLRFCEKLLFL
jgi:hypothetical protein